MGMIIIFVERVDINGKNLFCDFYFIICEYVVFRE